MLSVNRFAQTQKSFFINHCRPKKLNCASAALRRPPIIIPQPKRDLSFVSSLDIPKPCACAKAHDPTPSCCRPNCRAIRPRPAEIRVHMMPCGDLNTFGFAESDLFLLMARIPVFGFPCAWSAAPHHGGFRWEFASVVAPGAGDISRPTPLIQSKNRGPGRAGTIWARSS